jgi:hypothetical protein
LVVRQTSFRACRFETCKLTVRRSKPRGSRTCVDVHPLGCHYSQKFRWTVKTFARASVAIRGRQPAPARSANEPDPQSEAAKMSGPRDGRWATPLSFHSKKVTSLSFNANHAHIHGAGKIGKTKVSFTVDVSDKGERGTNDFFSIQFSNGYSASGYPLNGDISIH